jgi:tetratricopeptide (TPR) repeat protein
MSLSRNWHELLEDVLLFSHSPQTELSLWRDDDEITTRGQNIMTATYPTHEPALSRREALTTLVGMAGLTSLCLPTRSTPEELLPQCAATIDMCWHAIHGDGLLITERILPRQIWLLQPLAQIPSKYQQEAAGLLSRGYQLAGIIALHKNDLISRERYNRKAILYARIAGDRNIELAALMRLACTYHVTKQPMKALHVYQDALQYIHTCNPLFQGRIYAGLASAHAQCGQQQEAERYLGQAQATPLATSEMIPEVLYTDFGSPLVILYTGRAYRGLNQPGQAWNVYEQIAALRATVAVPERIRLEIINHQAEAALLLNDQERFCTTLRQGIAGAQAIRSARRRQEAIDIYGMARVVWPHERRVGEMGELFVV